MKSVIIYTSTHHGNTKKLAEAIAAHSRADLIDAVSCKVADLNDYDLIGFASGIAYGKYYPQLLQFMENNLPAGKNVFFMHTAGSPRESHADTAKAIAADKNCTARSVYFCKGFDTFGPFKFIGGIAKGHPNSAEIAGAVEFFERIQGELI